MFKIFNEYWYLDLDYLDNKLRIEPNSKEPKESDEPESQTINVVSYEVYKFLIEVLMTEKEDVDEAMGIRSSDVPIPFKLAFNTLVKDKILKKSEDYD